MKTTNILLSLAVIGTLTLGFAQTDSAINETVTVHKEAMKNATPEQRTELMNQFKEKMQNMSAEDRSAAMEQMQNEMAELGVVAQDMKGDAQAMGEVAKQRAQEHAQEMQMEHSQEMNRAQNMYQQQAGSQFGHDMQKDGGSINMENIQNNGSSWTQY